MGSFRSVTLSLLVISCISANVKAQSAGEILGAISGIVNLALKESTRQEWQKISRADIECITKELSGWHVTLDELISKGIRPTDQRLKGLRDDCAQHSANPRNADSKPAQIVAPTPQIFANAMQGGVRSPAEAQSREREPEYASPDQRRAAERAWEEYNFDERYCIQGSLKGRVTTIEHLIEFGILPTDPRIRDTVDGCRQTIQRREKARASEREQQQAAEKNRQAADERSRKELEERRAVQDEEQRQLARFQEEQADQKIRNRYLLVGSTILAIVVLLLFLRQPLKRIFASLGSVEGQESPDKGQSSPRKPIPAYMVLAIAMGLFVGLNEYFGWSDQLFRSLRREPIALATEIKTNPRSPNDRFGIIVVRNLSDQIVTLDKIQINNARSPNCFFSAGDALPLGGSTTLQAGESVIIGNNALLLGGCGPMSSVTISSDKGSVTHEYTWSR